MNRWRISACFPWRLTPVVSILGFLVSSVFLLWAQNGGLKSEERNALKTATVRVETTVGKETGSGSGFVVKVDGDDVYIATNQHVVSAGKDGKDINDFEARLRVRFAGEDLKAEPIRAELLASDQEHDLAILKVTRKDAPKPFDLFSDQIVEETTPITVFGYPLGDQYVTINTAQVSGFVHDSMGGLRRVKFYGKVDQGSSGGPVVDQKGAVIGVMVEGDRRSEGIGYCIPAVELHEMMRGRLGNFTIKQSGGPEDFDISFSAQLNDPLRRLKKVSLHYVLADDVTSDELESAALNNGTEWKLLSKKMKRVPMALRREENKASMTLRMSGETGDRGYLQLSYEREGEPNTVSAPIRISLGGKPIYPARYRGERREEDEGEKGKIRGRYPLPREAEESILGKRVTVHGYRVNEWNLDAKSLIPNITWDKNSLYLYMVSREGVVRKMDPFRNQIELELDLKLEVEWAELSGEGIVLVTKDEQLWVVDERYLRVRGVVEKVEGVSQVASARPSFYAFCVTGDGSTIEVYDLVDGIKTQTYQASDFAELPEGSAEGASPVKRFDKITMTPEGRYLLCESEGALHRFVVQDDELTYDQVGPRIGRSPKLIEVSEDGLYVSLVDTEGNRQLGDEAIPAFGTYVFDVSNLLEPSMAVDGGQPTPYVVREDSSRSVYGTVKNSPLVRFDLEGTKVREFPELEGEFASQVLVYPKRPGFLVVLTDAKLYVLKQL